MRNKHRQNNNHGNLRSASVLTNTNLKLNLSSEIKLKN